MSFEIKNHLGETLTQALITDIDIKSVSKSTSMALPGTNSDVLYDSGVGVRIFTLKGFVTGSTGISFFNNANGYFGSFSYISAIYQSLTLADADKMYTYTFADNPGMLLYLPSVYFSNLEWSDQPSNPMVRYFTVDLIEKEIYINSDKSSITLS